MEENKFKTYEKLCTIAANFVVIMTSAFFITDCITVGGFSWYTLPIRLGFFLMEIIHWFIYKKVKDYRKKRIILTSVPHMAFWCMFYCHIIMNEAGSTTMAILLLFFALLTSGFTMPYHLTIISTVAFAVESALMLILLPPSDLLVSCIYIGVALMVILFTNYSIDQNYSIQYKAEEELKKISITDTLTGVYNRKKLADIMIKGTRRLKGRLPITILMIDIDHFKRVNDTYGHQAGDKVLKNVALTISELTRSEDIVIRWGGEEFVVLLINSDLEGAVAVGSRIREAVEKSKVTISVTISVGVAAYNDNLDEAIRTADHRLYIAKENGRNQVVSIS